MSEELPVGTVRRAPAPSFAHAILCDQGGSPERWEIVDAYSTVSAKQHRDEEVEDWEIVYRPVPDEVWATVE